MSIDGAYSQNNQWQNAEDNNYQNQQYGEGLDDSLLNAEFKEIGYEPYQAELLSRHMRREYGDQPISQESAQDYGANSDRLQEASLEEACRVFEGHSKGRMDRGDLSNKGMETNVSDNVVNEYGDGDSVDQNELANAISTGDAQTDGHGHFVPTTDAATPSEHIDSINDSMNDPMMTPETHSADAHSTDTHSVDAPSADTHSTDSHSINETDPLVMTPEMTSDAHSMGSMGTHPQASPVTTSYTSLEQNPLAQSVGGGMSMEGLPADHSGTDHLKMAGLMMTGDAQQDFTLNNPDGNYELSSYISANKYVVQDAVERILAASPQLANYAANGDQGCIDLFENWVAQELTNINDIGNIQNPELQNAFLAEAQANGLNPAQIDHLLHTPISETGTGGLINENSSISGSLHTADLSRTRAESAGDGLYKVHLVSNNGTNNAHDNMNISTFYAEAGSAEEAVGLVNNAANRGNLDPNGRYNLTDTGMSILMSNLQNYVNVG